MPRIRSTKPEFWSDFHLGQLSRDARLLYKALWNLADEHARLAADPRLIKGDVFPYDDDMDPDAVDALMGELADHRKIVRYVVAGAPYAFIPSLHRHQRLEPNKVPSRLPAPPEPSPDGGGDGPGSGSSAPRADESARDSDAHPVDNAVEGAGAASSQVNPRSEVGADKSARRADESALLQGAGSREHGAGSRDQAAAAAAAPGDLPPAVAILRSKLNARRLTVRWDKLNADQLAEIEALVALHGDGPLVKAAVQSFRPDSPPVFAQAWLGIWQALPEPGAHLRAADDPACTEPGHTGTTRHCKECSAEALERGERTGGPR